MNSEHHDHFDECWQSEAAKQSVRPSPQQTPTPVESVEHLMERYGRFREKERSRQWRSLRRTVLPWALLLVMAVGLSLALGLPVGLGAGAFILVIFLLGAVITFILRAVGRVAKRSGEEVTVFWWW